MRMLDFGQVEEARLCMEGSTIEAEGAMGVAALGGAATLGAEEAVARCSKGDA